MSTVAEEDLRYAIENVVNKLNGIESLFPSQKELLKCLVENENVFFTSPTNREH